MSVRRRQADALRGAGLASLCLLALLAGGCGRGTSSSPASSTRPPAAEHAATATTVPVAVYRAGQFCTVSSRARYRRFGLTCHRSHLVAR
jgi:hypothetical protein